MHWVCNHQWLQMKIKCIPGLRKGHYNLSFNAILNKLQNLLIKDKISSLFFFVPLEFLSTVGAKWNRYIEFTWLSLERDQVKDSDI